jgi:hypothetical protein
MAPWREAALPPGCRKKAQEGVFTYPRCLALYSEWAIMGTTDFIIPVSMGF